MGFRKLLFKKKGRVLSKDNLLVNSPSSRQVKALVPWYHEKIPVSFKLWLKTELMDRASQSFKDEVTIDGIYESIEFLIRHKEMTLEEKKSKMASTLRVIMIRSALVDEIVTKIDTDMMNGAGTDPLYYCL